MPALTQPLINDEWFTIEVLSAQELPRMVPWLAMHQDYSEDLVSTADLTVFDSVEDIEKSTIKHLLNGDRGHFGPLEHTNFVFSCGYFPHSVIQQVRTHRVGVSFDVQSTRYTGQRVVDYIEGARDIEEVFYLRPIGEYRSRKGDKYTYTQEMREQDLMILNEGAIRYRNLIKQGVSEEHARYILPGYALRQHFIMSANTRTIMHLLDMRWKPNAELETQEWARLLFMAWRMYQPEIAQWYLDNRWVKGRLAP